MTESIGEFFADIDRRGPDLLPAKYSGTIRFDVSQDHLDEHWVLVIDRGRVSVLRDDREADCVVRARQDLFARVMTGQQGIYAAVWRNQISIEGELSLLSPLRELLPSAPGVRHRGRRKRAG